MVSGEQQPQLIPDLHLQVHLQAHMCTCTHTYTSQTNYWVMK